MAELTPLTEFGQHHLFVFKVGREREEGRVLGSRRYGSGPPFRGLSGVGAGSGGSGQAGGPKGGAQGGGGEGEGVGTRREGPVGWGTSGWGPKGGWPKISRFFPSPATIVFPFFPLLGVSKCKPPGFHTTAREPKRAFEGAGLQKHHQNSTRRHRREGRKSGNCGERGKKARNFGRSW